MAINQKQPGDYGYICHYGKTKVEVYTKDGTYAAQKMVAAHLKVKSKDTYKIIVTLAELPDDTDYVHTAVN